MFVSPAPQIRTFDVLTPKVMVLDSGAFGRSLGLDEVLRVEHRKC